MTSQKRKRLESTVTALQRRYGRCALQTGRELAQAPPPPHISTGFPQLDTLTGCGGVPLRALTLFSGKMTSGKLTLAYGLLAKAQGTVADAVALLDLNGSTDTDYLQRCGVKLPQLFLVRPTAETQTLQLLVDLVETRQLHLVVVDSVADLLHNRAQMRQFQTMLPRLLLALQQSACALLLVDEYMPLWRRWFDASWTLHQAAALHVELRHERWLTTADKLLGYEAQAQVRKSR